jgi:hypothetical protein
MVLFLWGAEPFLVLLNACVRMLDRLTGTRASVYGWALQFGACAGPVDEVAAVNVCVRCGRGHASGWLEGLHATYRFWGLVPAYRCPSCSAVNVYFRDGAFGALRLQAPGRQPSEGEK